MFMWLQAHASQPVLGEATRPEERKKCAQLSIINLIQL
jgi:hypothetical protein